MIRAGEHTTEGRYIEIFHPDRSATEASKVVVDAVVVDKACEVGYSAGKTTKKNHELVGKFSG